jgi:hypothetical protein
MLIHPIEHNSGKQKLKRAAHRKAFRRAMLDFFAGTVSIASKPRWPPSRCSIASMRSTDLSADLLPAAPFTETRKDNENVEIDTNRRV